MMKSFLSVFLLVSTPSFVRAADLIEPPVISSSNGVLDTTITLERATHSQDGFTITSRLLNGMLPGPTLRIKAGDVLKIKFQNLLPDQGLGYTHNRLSAPDETNLHFHGLHISGELPSDDVLLHLGPGESYDYLIEVPSDHMPGTHWLHPHRHGSTSIQVGGGASLAVIVEDPPGYLPAAIANAKEVVLVTMQMHMEDLDDAVRASNDGLLTYSGVQANARFLLTNGQINPTIRADAGEWIRLRVIFAAWVSRDLGMTINGCEMQLLSKDGIYINDFPRRITSAPVVQGGRADIMVRCPQPSRTYTINGWRGNPVATIQTSATTVMSGPMPSWTPTYPSYLTDLRNTPATPGCSCSTNVGDNDGINNRRFALNEVLHYAPLGAVIQRNVDADDHPYHQHVYPYQLVSVQQNTYYKVGDWHDSILGSAVIRHQAARFPGKIMIHCHRLEHEDEGMMAMEYVDPSTTAQCGCGFRTAPNFEITNAPIGSNPLTPAPVAPLTQAPTPAPTPRPSPAPTPAPTPGATPAPTPMPAANMPLTPDSPNSRRGPRSNVGILNSLRGNIRN